MGPPPIYAVYFQLERLGYQSHIQGGGEGIRFHQLQKIEDTERCSFKLPSNKILDSTNSWKLYLQSMQTFSASTDNSRNISVSSAWDRELTSRIVTLKNRRFAHDVDLNGSKTAPTPLLRLSFIPSFQNPHGKLHNSIIPCNKSTSVQIVPIRILILLLLFLYVFPRKTLRTFHALLIVSLSCGGL